MNISNSTVYNQNAGSNEDLMHTRKLRKIIIGEDQLLPRKVRRSFFKIEDHVLMLLESTLDPSIVCTITQEDTETIKTALRVGKTCWELKHSYIQIGIKFVQPLLKSLVATSSLLHGAPSGTNSAAEGFIFSLHKIVVASGYLPLNENKHDFLSLPEPWKLCSGVYRGYYHHCLHHDCSFEIIYTVLDWHSISVIVKKGDTSSAMLKLDIDDSSTDQYSDLLLGKLTSVCTRHDMSLMNIIDLPRVLMLNLMKRLDIKTLTALASCCKSLNNLYREDIDLWQYLCARDYPNQIDPSTSGFSTYKVHHASKRQRRRSLDPPRREPYPLVVNLVSPRPELYPLNPPHIIGGPRDLYPGGVPDFYPVPNPLIYPGQFPRRPMPGILPRYPFPDHQWGDPDDQQRVFDPYLQDMRGVDLTRRPPQGDFFGPHPHRHHRQDFDYI